MSGLDSLIVNSSGYKRILADKQSNRLSHAYLLISKEKEFLEEQLIIFAKLIMAEGQLNNDRINSLIEKKEYPDVEFYPKNEKGISSDDINDLIEKSFYKPLESNKKLFVLCGGENMTVASQNKLLKTLEEPPENTYILIGVRSEFPLLQTVKSRVKKLEIEAFSFEQLFSALKEKCSDSEKLQSSISVSDGTYGNAYSLYTSEKFSLICEYAQSVLFDMKSSREVLDYSVRFDKLGIDIAELLSVLECYLEDMLFFFQGKKELIKNKIILEKISNPNGFNLSSVVYALEQIAETDKRKKANCTNPMMIERLLFSILEGKHTWQK